MTAELRQLFKYLRFNQLLSTIRKEEELYRITVDGPAQSLLQNETVWHEFS